MNRLICTREGVEFDLTAPYLPQLTGFIHMASLDSICYLREIVKAFGRSIKYIVDVGACIGGHAVAYRIAFPNAKILAIEPSKWNFPYLERNTKSLPNVKRIKCLALDKDGDMQIGGPTPVQRPRMDNSVNTGLISIWGQGLHFRETVPTRLLDNLVAERVDWLKIDVEGAEMEVLHGATDILLKHRPIVQMEMRPDNQAMAGRAAVVPHKIMKRHGYRVVSGIGADWIYFPYDHNGS